MPARPLPEGTISRVEAAEMLGVVPRRITRWVKAGKLQHPPTGKVDGLVLRHEVEALAAACLESRRRRAVLVERPLPDLSADQEATLEERLAAVAFTRDEPGPFINTAEAARILGISQVYVGMLAAKGRLPWLPTGRSGGQPARVYRRGADRGHCAGAERRKAGRFRYSVEPVDGKAGRVHPRVYPAWGRLAG
jgi:hypothetical protein